MVKLKTFKTGVIMLIFGIAFGIHANLRTYVDNEGFLHESFSTPMSAILVITGIILLVASSLIFCLKTKK